MMALVHTCAQVLKIAAAASEALRTLKAKNTDLQLPLIECQQRSTLNLNHAPENLSQGHTCFFRAFSGLPVQIFRGLPNK